MPMGQTSHKKNNCRTTEGKWVEQQGKDVANNDHHEPLHATTRLLNELPVYSTRDTRWTPMPVLTRQGLVGFSKEN